MFYDLAIVENETGMEEFQLWSIFPGQSSQRVAQLVERGLRAGNSVADNGRTAAVVEKFKQSGNEAGRWEPVEQESAARANERLPPRRSFSDPHGRFHSVRSPAAPRRRSPGAHRREQREPRRESAGEKSGG